MHILYTSLQTFPEVLTKRIWLKKIQRQTQIIPYQDWNYILFVFLPSGLVKDGGKTLRELNVSNGVKMMVVGSTINDVMKVTPPPPGALKDEKSGTSGGVGWHETCLRYLSILKTFIFESTSKNRHNRCKNVLRWFYFFFLIGSSKEPLSKQKVKNSKISLISF